MKKCASIIAICMVLVLCIPCVSARASLNINQFIIRTQASVDADTSTMLGNALNSTVFCDQDSGYGGQGNLYTEQIIDAVADFDFSVLENFDYYYVSAVWNNGSGLNESWTVYVCCFNSTLQPFIVTQDYNGSHYPIDVFASAGAEGRLYQCYFYSNSHGTFNSGDSFMFHDGVSSELNGYQYAGFGRYVLDSNIPVISSHEIDTLKPFDANRNVWVCNGGFSSCTDIFAGAYGFDAQGNIVDPSAPTVEIEDNENHMYLKSCDAGFCKPYSMSDLSTAGGGYLYVKYTYDNWINSHSSDYWVNIRTVVNVDGTQYSGLNTRALDLNGINVLTFSESTVPNGWGDEGLLFVEFPDTLVSSYKTGYVYSIPYATFASTDSNGVNNRSRFLGNGRNRLFLTPSGGRGYNITDSPLGSALENIFIVNSHSKFTVTVTVWLQDTDDNRSGEFTKTFNLITGVATTTDTSITDNNNPFEPDPSVPDVPDGTSGDSNSVAPIVNNFVINGNGTFSGVIHDDSLENLKETVDAYPNVPNQHFWQYFLVYKDNAFLDATSDFFGALPNELSALLISSIGIIGVFAIYRFVRRR